MTSISHATNRSQGKKALEEQVLEFLRNSERVCYTDVLLNFFDYPCTRLEIEMILVLLESKGVVETENTTEIVNTYKYEVVA